MQRLTKKINENRRKYKIITNADLYPHDYVADDSCIRLDNAVDKLGRLEDIEEEFGIDLITLLKALTNGYWHYDENKYVHYDGYIALYNNGGEYYIGTCLLSNYGKTWALTKEELE